MNHVLRAIDKPQRWDKPFSAEMTEADVESLLAVEPFRSIRESAFPPSTPLRGILQNDCRLIDTKPNEIVIRQGDYGHSAFLILDGSLLVSLRPISTSALGPSPLNKKTWWSAIAQLWTNSKHCEVRHAVGDDSIEPTSQPIAIRREGNHTRVFVQDIPATMDLGETQIMRTGSIFGELSALARTPRTATVISQGCARLLEIRWQGLRDLMKFDPGLRGYIDQLYREHGLKSHLAETPLLKELTPDAITEIAQHTEFQSIGEYLWTPAFKMVTDADIAERINAEHVIAQQGEYINGLILIRSGFARVSRRHGDGEQTIEYLGKGRCFGLRELFHNWKSGEQRPWQLSLRAVGYVDILQIPVEVVEKSIFPHLAGDQIPPPLSKETPTGDSSQRRLAAREPNLETSLLERLVEQRLINGTEAMVIDLHRCTRCDDCVRACAAAHDNNPRFVRDGQTIGQWMFANACMQCLDPVCMIGCPTGAIGREVSTGVITINPLTCIGCGTCANSCPYNNIKMVAISDSSGVPVVEKTTGLPVYQATKCDLCIDQLGGPACQRACPHDALIRIDLTSPHEFTNWIKG